MGEVGGGGETLASVGEVGVDGEKLVLVGERELVEGEAGLLLIYRGVSGKSGKHWAKPTGWSNYALYVFYADRRIRCHFTFAGQTIF